MHTAQNGVYVPAGGPLARFLHQVDAIGDSGVRWNAVEKAQLKNAHTKGDAHFGIEFRVRAPGKLRDQEIELGPITQYAEDDFRGKPGIAGVECRGVKHQKI